jgi:hypothetical protein
MSEAACKAIICETEAQQRLIKAVNKIDGIQGASTDLRIKHSEIYIGYLKKAQAAADKAVFDSGE